VDTATLQRLRGVPTAYHWGRGRGGLQQLRRLVARRGGGWGALPQTEAVGVVLGQLLEDTLAFAALVGWRSLCKWGSNPLTA
jgi:hypothetical protein